MQVTKDVSRSPGAEDWTEYKLQETKENPWDASIIELARN